MDRFTAVFLACVGTLAGVAIGFSCAGGEASSSCSPDTCTAECVSTGRGIAGRCDPSLGCVCVQAADADADADADDGGREDVAAPDDAPGTPDEATDDAVIRDDTPIRDDTADRRDDGPVDPCNATGTCDPTECPVCCSRNYGTTGTCIGTRCDCSGTPGDGGGGGG